MAKPLKKARKWIRDLRKSPMHRRNDQYDRDTFHIISTLPKGATCIDIGAASGTILQEMIDKVAEGTFYAFEARPGAATLLKENFPGVTVHSMALSNEVGEATFNEVVDNSGYSGLRRQEYPGEYAVKEIKVAVECLDNIIPDDCLLYTSPSPRD